MGLCCTELKFDLQESIGSEGLNSTVYKAFDPQLNANLVVKKVSKKSIIEDYNSIDESNFFNESRMLYETKHPNIAEIQYASEDVNFIYFSMPYYKNGSLNALLNKRFLTVKEIIKYSLEFLSGIHYIHTKDLIHFDIKPTNIMINNNGKAMVTDFGLAKYTDSFGLASPNKIYNSHRPPEASNYSDFSKKADIYQAGLTLYRMCNGNDYFHYMYNHWITQGKLMEAISKGKFPDRRYYLPHIPSSLRRIINKAINIDVDKRYDTILDMINDISKVEENLNWVYNKDTNVGLESWSNLNEKETHINRIELVQKGNNIFDTVAKKIRVSDKKENKINKWSKKDIDLSNSKKEIESFIKNN